MLISNLAQVIRGDVHGVTYSIDDKEEAWTLVVGRRSKRPKRSVSLHLLCLKAPPQVKQNLPSSVENDCSGADLVIPDQANVKFSIIDGKPGLQVNTKYTKSWTPIAAHT